MDGDADFIDKYVRVKERLYLLSNSKSAVIKNIDNITLRHFGLGITAKGETVEAARWLNEYLEAKGVVKGVGDGLDVELYKALNREKIAGLYQLGLLKSDFYQRLKVYLKKGGAEGELQRARVYALDLITLRLNKLTALAVSTSDAEKILTMLTPEESMVFNAIRHIARSWKKTILGDM